MLAGQRPLLLNSRAQEFTTQIRDIYVAPGDNGFWLGAFRDPAAGEFAAVTAAIERGDPLMPSLLYGDYEGGTCSLAADVDRVLGRPLRTAPRDGSLTPGSRSWLN